MTDDGEASDGGSVPTYVVNVDVAVARGDEYLFIERAAGEDHAAGLLAFPGGKVEGPPDGTDPLAATARREVREEVGVEVADVRYVTANTFESDAAFDVLNVVVTADYAGGEAHVREPAEVAAVEWLTADELVEREPPEFLHDYIAAVEALRSVE